MASSSGLMGCHLGPSWSERRTRTPPPGWDTVTTVGATRKTVLVRSPVRTFVVAVLVTVLILLVGVGALSGLGPLVSDEPVTSPWGPMTFGTLRPNPTFARSGQYGEPTEWTPLNLPAWIGQLVIAVVVALIALVALRFLFMIAAAVEKRRNAVAVEVEELTAAEVDLEVDEVQESFSQTIVDLRAGLDVHGAIIECWRRLADLAADSGVPRRASQTAEEYTLAILGSLPVDRTDLRTLGRLYEAAMFSGQDSVPADRDLAIGCLERLSASLGVTP